MISKQDIVNANPVLIVYPAGVGGEHIAHTLSVCSNEFEDLSAAFNYSRNQYHTQCVLRYTQHVENIDDFDSAIATQYKGNFVAKNKRIIIKDHPTQHSVDFYSKHFDNLIVLLVFPLTQAVYFSELAFKKLSVKVSCPIDRKYLSLNVTDNLTEQQIDHILSEVNQHEWVWRHEIHNLVSAMSETKTLCPIEHHNTLDIIKMYHADSIINTYTTLAPLYQAHFKNSYVINCDDLTTNSSAFWKQIQHIIPTLDVETATSISNVWIERNNKLGFSQ